MAQNKYQIIEFKPTANQTGMSHSFHAEAVVDNIITNRELARKIEARGISRAAEIKSILEEAANVIMEEIQENNRVQLESGDGVLVSIFPSVSGSVSDAYVQQHQDKYPGKSVAEESMLTPDMLTWGIKATIGLKFSKQFAMNKTAQKVAYNPAQQTAEPAEGGDQQGGGTEGGSSTDPNE